MNKELKKMQLENRLAKLKARPSETKNIERKLERQLRNFEKNA